MRKKLDVLLGRTSKQTSKLKALLGLTVSRLAVLRNQRHVRCAQARGDVVQLLQLGHHDRALLRVEQVIKEQNMLDVFVMTEGYCHLITERAALFEDQKECPEELREAAASLIFAASRCGNLPELQDVRRIFASKFGKEFAASAVDLRNNCGVNTKMIQKLSTRQPSLESRIRVTKEIAAERGISVDIDEPSSQTTEINHEPRQNNDQSQEVPDSSAGHIPDASNLESNEDFSESMKARQKYKDVASAAQAAFESAEYAAAAARAAVELARFQSQGKPSDDQNGSGNGRHGSKEWKKHEGENLTACSSVEKFNQVKNYNSESEDLQAGTYKSSMPQLEKSSSSSSSDSIEVPLAKHATSEIKFDESDSDTEKRLDSGRRISQALQSDRQFNRGLDEDSSERKGVIYPRPPYQKRNIMRYTESSGSSLQRETHGMGLGSGNEDNPVANYSQERRSQTEPANHDSEKLGTQRSNKQGPVSMRTRKGI